MNQLKQKIIETEKEIEELNKFWKGRNEDSNKYFDIKEATLSALKLAEEIQNENVKKLKDIIGEFAFGDTETNIEVSRELIKKINEVFEE